MKSTKAKKAMKSTPARKQASLKTPLKARLATKQRWPLAVFVLAFALVGGVAIYKSFAATAAQFYVNPASSTVDIGQTFTVAVRINPGTTVDTVDATLTYDPAVLQFVSADASSSPFATEVALTGGSGSVHLARAVLAPATVTSDALVANLTFTALVSANSTPLTVAGHVAYQGTEVVSTATNGAVIVSQPAPPADTVAPMVTITNPASGATVTRTTVTAAATDNVGVKKMELYIDNKLTYTTTTSNLSYVWNNKGGGKKSTQTSGHTLVVKAYDAANNVGSATVTTK
jgi:hypothetical protein